MTTHTQNAVNAFAPLTSPAHTCTPVEREFLFGLEGELYQLESLSSMLEPLLLDTINQMRAYDRGRAAAVDYAVCNLRQRIHDLSHAYEALNRAGEQQDGERQRDGRGRFLKAS